MDRKSALTHPNCREDGSEEEFLGKERSIERRSLLATAIISKDAHEKQLHNNKKITKQPTTTVKIVITEYGDSADAAE